MKKGQKCNYVWTRHARPIETCFFEKVIKQTEGCWIWTAAMDAGGYGVIRYKKNTLRSA